jgi:hypothetical protein
MSNAVKAALKDGLQRMEITIPPIPNVEVKVVGVDVT